MVKKRFTLAELAVFAAAQPVGDSNFSISGVDTLEDASPEDISFFSNPRYLEAMKKSKAGILCVAPQTPLLSGRNYLVSEDPSRTFQSIAELLCAPSRSAFEGIHPTAVIHESAELGSDVTVGPYAVIDCGVKIAQGTVIGPHVFVGHEVEIGASCILYPLSVVRERCHLGNRVILQSGACIGSCGFGYTLDEEGHFHKLEQLGIVILEDDVEIGAHTTIDRARFKATIVRRGTKIDNLCQIAHNVEIGEDNAMAAQSGIAGSATTGKNCLFGGQVGILGHVHLDNGVLLTTRAGASKSLKAGKYRGSPAIPLREFHRQEVHVRKLEAYAERLKKLEQRLALLEEKEQPV